MKDIVFYFRWMLVFLLASMIGNTDFLNAKESKEPKGYLEELEEAFIAKIARERASRRVSTQEKITSSEKENEQSLKSGNNTEVGEDVVEDIKNICKDPLINFLATNDLIAWNELKGRFEKAKKSIEDFELKYKAKLGEPEAQVTEVKIEESKEEGEVEETEAGSEEESEESPQKLVAKPASKSIPGAKPGGMPGVARRGTRHSD